MLEKIAWAIIIISTFISTILFFVIGTVLYTKYRPDEVIKENNQIIYKKTFFKYLTIKIYEKIKEVNSNGSTEQN